MRIKQNVNALIVSLLLCTLFALNSCKKNESVAPVPKFEAVADKGDGTGVTAANTGASVIIKGSNFSSNPSENIVKFNGATAKVTSATSTELTTIVPEEATTGKISITVNGITTISSTDFVISNVAPLPIINSFSPSSGFPSHDGEVGSTVYISGASFLSNPQVKFNGVPALILSSSASGIVTTVPAGATTGKISVSSGGATAMSSKDYIVRPVNESVILGWRTTCENFIIRGENFRSIPSLNEVKFNGTPATVTSSSFSELVTTLPANATSGPFTVTINGFTSTSASIIIPELRTFSPISGEPGTSVTLTGANIAGFQYTDKNSLCHEVKFNGIRAVVTSVSENQMTAVVPPGATSGKITISGNGRTTTSSADFIVSLAPTISSFVPASGAPGSQVSVFGSNFVTGAISNEVRVNGVAANVVNVSSRQIVMTIPDNATTGKITITTPGGSAVSDTDLVVTGTPPPMRFFPAQGPSGTMVTIDGSGFSSIREDNIVHFGFSMELAQVLNASPTRLNVIVPPSASSGRISVTVNGVTTTSAVDYHVIIAPPMVLDLTPSNGVAPSPGVPGTRVVITGVNFSMLPFENVVKFGNVVAPVIFSTPNRLEVNVPPGASTGPVTVTIQGMTSGGTPRIFTVQP